jgi:hypothetical protein
MSRPFLPKQFCQATQLVAQKIGSEATIGTDRGIVNG